MGGTGGPDTGKVNKAPQALLFTQQQQFNPGLQKEDAHKYSEVMYSILLNYWCEILIKKKTKTKLESSFKKEISEGKKNLKKKKTLVVSHQ